MHRSQSSTLSVNGNEYTVKNNSCKTWGDVLCQMQKSEKEENCSQKLVFFFFYEVWRLADIKHKYEILYMYLYKPMIFCLSKTVQNGKENYTNDLLIAL